MSNTKTKTPARRKSTAKTGNGNKISVKLTSTTWERVVEPKRSKFLTKTADVQRRKAGRGESVMFELTPPKHAALIKFLIEAEAACAEMPRGEGGGTLRGYVIYDRERMERVRDAA